MNSLFAERLRDVGKSVVRAAAVTTSRWRDEPSLVIIGVKRGGTTSLFRDLERHPGMCPLVPSARRLPLRENQKGVHFFDSNFERGHAWYRSHFPTRFARNLTSRQHGPTFTAEASPYYFFHPLAAERATTALPTALFVVLLRDPVERTVSHWSEQTRNGIETLSLTEALDAESERLGAAAIDLETGKMATSNAHEQQSYATQSEYVNSLRRWFDLAGRERVHVAFSEDYYAQPATVINEITALIGVPPMPSEAVGDHRNAAPRPSDLDPLIEAQLVDRFRPDVEQLADLIGRQPPWPRFGLQSTVELADDKV
jgi:hypothetical protein